MSFNHPTFIVLDLPEAISEKVMAIRVANKDKFRSSLPVEITVAGSTGVGIISKNQNEEDVYKIVDEIATTTKPFSLSFRGVEKVPGIDVYVLKMKDETELIKLHTKLKHSAIKFDVIDSAYAPHCTLRSRTPITDEEIEALMKIKIDDEFVVDTLTIYMLEKLPIRKMYSVKLTGC